MEGGGGGVGCCCCCCWAGGACGGAGWGSSRVVEVVEVVTNLKISKESGVSDEAAEMPKK